MITHMKYNVLLLFVLLAFFAGCNKTASKSTLPIWAIGPFERPENVNPIIKPEETTFYCALTGDTIPWENGDTFNPAATIKNDTICILYRAEDQSGQGIGQRTSRIGFAQSIDGTTLVKNHVPRFFFQQKIHSRNLNGLVDVKIQGWQLPRMVLMSFYIRNGTGNKPGLQWLIPKTSSIGKNTVRHLKMLIKENSLTVLVNLLPS